MGDSKGLYCSVTAPNTRLKLPAMAFFFGRLSILYGQDIRFDTWQKFMSSQGNLSVLSLSALVQPIPRWTCTKSTSSH